MSDQCFQCDLYRKSAHLTVGVKPYLPGKTISRSHSFVKKLDDWKLAYGKIPKMERTPRMYREHPGNPWAVIEGEDNIDYVLHDKSEGGRHFADQRAKDLTDDFLSDLGEALADTGAGLPPKYLQSVIMLPTDGTLTQYKYDKEDYHTEYKKQRSAKKAKEQLPKGCKGKTPEQVITEVMMSDMVIGTIRQRLGYYELSTNDRFENVTDRLLMDLLAVDGNQLSGTNDMSLSPLFVRKIGTPEFSPKTTSKSGTSLIVSSNFEYGFGRLFSEKRILTTRGCRPSKFLKGSNVKYLRRVGIAYPSFLGVGGTFVETREEIMERGNIMKQNEDAIRERMVQTGVELQAPRPIFPEAHLDMTRRERSAGTTEKTCLAHFVLYLRTRLDHRSILPLVLVAELIKSELVTFLTLLRIADAQTRDPLSVRYDPGPLELGERTIFAYQRLVETLYPCKSWWNDGTIVKGERWKLSTMSLFSFQSTRLAPKMNDVREVLGIDDEDERTIRVFEKIEKECELSSKRYLFLPVMESKAMLFTRDDKVFCANNRRHILTEKEVTQLFKLRDEENEGRFPLTMVSAVVSLGAFESSESQSGSPRVCMTAELQQPNKVLLKTEPIRVFCIPNAGEEEREPDYACKIQGYLQSLHILAHRDQTTLTRENIEEYLERLDLPDKEREDVIHCLVEEMAVDDVGVDDGEDTGRWRNRNDTEEEDAPLAKQARVDQS